VDAVHSRPHPTAPLARVRDDEKNEEMETRVGKEERKRRRCLARRGNEMWADIE